MQYLEEMIYAVGAKFITLVLQHRLFINFIVSLNELTLPFSDFFQFILFIVAFLLFFFLPMICYIKCFSISSISFFGLLSRLLQMSEDLHNTRTKLIEKVQLLNVEPTISMLNSAISCHMRPEPNKTEKKTKK